MVPGSHGEAGAGGQEISLTKNVVIDDDPIVEVKNPALDTGVHLPGFNDDFAGAGPDMGAFETDRPPLRFAQAGAVGVVLTILPTKALPHGRASAMREVQSALQEFEDGGGGGGDAGAESRVQIGVELA